MDIYEKIATTQDALELLKDNQENFQEQFRLQEVLDMLNDEVNSTLNF